MRNNEYQADPDPIQRMENQLSSGLNPVQPDPEFVRRLKRRLEHPPAVSIEAKPEFPRLLAFLVIMTAGISILWGINKIRRMIIN